MAQNEVLKFSVCSYHCAHKKIPSVDGVVDGIKLEQYIFDAFPYAPSVGLFEVRLRIAGSSQDFVDVLRLSPHLSYFSDSGNPLLTGSERRRICSCEECLGFSHRYSRDRQVAALAMSYALGRSCWRSCCPHRAYSYNWYVSCVNSVLAESLGKVNGLISVTHCQQD